MTDRDPGAAAPAAGTNPFRLDLDQQRKRAKTLLRGLRGLRAGDPAAMAHFVGHHPHGAALPDPACLQRLSRLSEAQLVVAREFGLSSWPRLVAHVEAMRVASDRIATGATPDGDSPTLRIRCGSDLMLPLVQAGFVGGFLDYSDPLCQGPLLPDPDWRSRRAAFLVEAYGARTGRSLRRTEAGLARAERKLRDASHHPRVVIWVEHDSYDQLVLARCLAEFADNPPHRLELISASRYPGDVRFIGLGQLPPDALRLLWDKRIAVGAAALSQGRAVWSMLRAADPSALADAAQAGMPSLPHMAAAIRRHCQELPWTRDGLGLTERLVLQLLAEAPQTVGALFTALTAGREPLPWLGDIMLPFILQGLRSAPVPLIEPSVPVPLAEPSTFAPCVHAPLTAPSAPAPLLAPSAHAPSTASSAPTPLLAPPAHAPLSAPSPRAPLLPPSAPPPLSAPPASLPLFGPSAPTPSNAPSAPAPSAPAPLTDPADATPAPDWAGERLAITDAGLAVLAGEVDALSLSPPDRWLGGVHITGPGPCWRWDEPTATTRLQ